MISSCMNKAGSKRQSEDADPRKLRTPIIWNVCQNNPQSQFQKKAIEDPNSKSMEVWLSSPDAGHILNSICLTCYMYEIATLMACPFMI